MLTWKTTLLSVWAVTFMLSCSLAQNTGKRTNFPDLHYDTDRAELPSDSTVSSIINYLKKYQRVKLIISGHTDNVGSDAYNLNLSQARARNVYDFLVEQGIPVNRMSYEGLGEKQPKASNETESGRATNRRVELKITKPGLKKPESLPKEYDTQGIINLKNRAPTLQIHDCSQIDGDIVTLLINGDTLVENLEVVRRFKTFRLTNLKPGMNWLGVIAIDQGSQGAASICIRVDDGGTMRRFVIKALLNKPGAYLINVP